MVSSEEQDTERVGGASASGARVQKKRPAERPPSNVESEDEGAPVEETLPGAKKKRRPTPIRVNLEPPALEGGEPGSFDLSDRQVVDKPNGRYNKNVRCSPARWRRPAPTLGLPRPALRDRFILSQRANVSPAPPLLASHPPDADPRRPRVLPRYPVRQGVCYHKASNKWRAIVYVNKKQVNLGYYNEKDDAEHQVNLARLYGLPKGFENLRALQQPKRSDVPGVNWDSHCKRWLARVYEPSGNGKKGKEHKVGYFPEEKEAAEAVREFREKLGLPPKSRWRTKKEETPGQGPSEPQRNLESPEQNVAQLPPSASAEPVGAGEVVGAFAVH